ncbi:pupal cuticle protein C1B-like isoform X2 [Cotesia glomerata]|uniref:pupal cuticle protein C1B-like isoform X2 n=1 Tax=Cotesia glomerata TaxID=32391 RepID=UPI001D02A1D2|nr:pupal cuticle protein C1B-like isoform X2 [Cotesia glomerata]
MFKFVTLFALVACAFAAPAPAPGYAAGHIVAASVHPQTYVAAPAVHASYVAAPAVAYQSAPLTTYAHAAPVVTAYHTPAASSHQQTTQIHKSEAIVTQPIAHLTAYHAAPAYAYYH